VQLDFVLCQAAGTCYGNKPFILALTVPVIIMSLANSYKFLSYLSIPSIVIAILGMICIFFYAFSELALGRTSHSELKYFDIYSIIGRIGLAMYIFDGNAIVLSIRAEAREKKAQYPSILKRAIVFTLVLFIVFSTICYYVYREQSQPIFTTGLTPLNSLIIFILTCICINALTSYPVQMLAAFNILEKFEVLQLKPLQEGASLEE
jgi:amino acid permease